MALGVLKKLSLLWSSLKSKLPRLGHEYRHVIKRTQCRILGLRAVANDFHARFDCLERCYRYRIWNRNTSSALYPWRHWWMPRTLDVAAMQRAAYLLRGEHDFSAFRATSCQASSPIKHLCHADVVRHEWSVEFY